MVNTSLYQLNSSEFQKHLEILCDRAKKRKIAHAKHIINNWHGKETFEFLEYRAYSPGDDLRKVDWNIYKRLGNVVIKEYEIEPPKHLFILIDISSSTVPYHKLEYIKMIAAALAYVGMAVVDKISFSFFPHDKNMLIQSFSHNSSILNFFSYLDKLQTNDSQKSLFDSLSGRNIFSRNTNLIIISDFYNKQDLCALKLLRCPSSAIQVVAKEEILPPKLGNITLIDSENEKKHELHLDHARWAIYKQNFNNHLLHVKHLCWQNKINYQLIKTNNDISIILSILQIAGIIK